ncbi:hypothetical protein WJU16_01010 [Chitinophaga pollutisoli]|uniref:Lipocalin-like domain-containing protein n=1 Tax=Chitinophaga pollutisoli TaxID=3133966 RepID=A0ABZ2YQK8_9BACT
MRISSLAIASVLIFTACGKENNEELKQMDALSGTYEYVSLYVKGKSEITYKDGNDNMNLVSEMEYTSRETAGMVLFEQGSMITSGYTYKVNSDYNFQSFTNGKADGPAQSYPFQFSTPKTNGVSKYRIAGDSVFLDKAFNHLPGTGGQPGQIPAIPVGAKFALSNDDLSIISTISIASPLMQEGVPATQKQTFVMITRLKKR